MIYITGDTHAEIDISKLNSKNWEVGNKLTKDDYLIVCGDFGLVWDESKTDTYWQKWLSDKQWTTLFIDGNHENFNLLNAYPTTYKWGGKVHQITDSIYHLMRGQVFTIDGNKIFTMGGATSTDKLMRVKDKTWWENEIPSKDEFNEALDNLNKADWNVDLVITHCAPSKVLDCIQKGYKHDICTQFLQVISERLKFQDWYMGQYHINDDIGSYHILYDKIIKYTERKEIND